MLEADDLKTLVDALRPPAGHQLDRAVGTTYSLDLDALITAPLAFALFDAEESEDGTTNVPALLEAIRRYSDRIDVFCQAGMIALPATHRPIVAHLEGSVHAVAPRKPRRVFHPKVWALRFVPTDGGPEVFRLLVLSRNLTFDNSRDTIVILEGTRGGANALRQRNAPLARFVRELPRLAIHSVARQRRTEIEALADELQLVDFELPGGFSELRFWSLGIGGKSSWPFPKRLGDPKLVVSPFLSAPLLKRLGSSGTLVSRADSLDAIAADDLGTFGESFVLADTAAIGEPDVQERRVTEETIAEAPGSKLRGLHAKVFVFDAGWEAHVFTGSANATSAAFSGNVEFLVELVGAKKRCGVNAMLNGSGGTGFRELLEPYDPTAASPALLDQTLEAALDELRRAIATQQFNAKLEPTDEVDRFRLTLRAANEVLLLEGASAQCWPITLRGHALPLTHVWSQGATFPVSNEGITAFFAVELVLHEGRKRARVEFVVRAELEGAPPDRLDRLLVQLLRSRGDVLRYMLFLLAGDDVALATLRGVVGDAGSGSGHERDRAPDLPLVEWLVRAVSRSPERIDHLARLIASLRSTEEGRELLPEGFDDVWDAIWSARSAAR